MKLSTKGRYAVTAMLDLTLNRDKGPVTLSEISECQDISLSYLEQLFARLRRNGLVKGVRGPGGGYRLARDPEQISVAEVISAVDEVIDVTRCHGEENCQEGHRCLTHSLWKGLTAEIHDFLHGISLAEVVASRDDVTESQVTLPEPLGTGSDFSDAASN